MTSRWATSRQAYFRIWIKDALITSVQLSGSNENPSESVSFAFQAVEIAYSSPRKTTVASTPPSARATTSRLLTADFAADDPPSD